MILTQIEQTMLQEAEESRSMAMALIDRGLVEPILVAQILRSAGDLYVEFSGELAKRVRAEKKKEARP